MVEILIHDFDGEPCELGLDRYDHWLCQHGFRIAWIWNDWNGVL